MPSTRRCVLVHFCLVANLVDDLHPDERAGRAAGGGLSRAAAECLYRQTGVVGVVLRWSWSCPGLRAATPSNGCMHLQPHCNEPWPTSYQSPSKPSVATMGQKQEAKHNTQRHVGATTRARGMPGGRLVCFAACLVLALPRSRVSLLAIFAGRCLNVAMHVTYWVYLLHRSSVRC